MNRTLQQMKDAGDVQEAWDLADKWQPPVGLQLSDANGALIVEVMNRMNLIWSHSNLTAIALSSELRNKLTWDKPAAPVAPVVAPAPAAVVTPAEPVDNRSKTAKLFGLSWVDTSHPSQADRAAENAKKDARFTAFRNDIETQKRESAAAQTRWEKENVTVYHNSGNLAGRIDHAETQRLRALAVKANAAANATVKAAK